MSVYHYEPSYNVDRFFDFLNGFSSSDNQLTQGGQGQQTDSSNAVLRPRMDIHEDKEQNIVTVSFELPGLKKEDVDIDVQDGRLTVSGETKSSEEHEKDGYAIRERRFGKFSRTLTLPKGVKDDTIKASMENGVLTVTFPKNTPEAAPKKITIS
ncbi:small heat shock protein [Dendrothele bispora CBS 962.96]|uniref:Small heat shock protein n=1 Tax=Dendrothele bispora (strain CBS 962.96) TaxID=1314807 RepID=A0A4S8LX17_DENBC|nr:small heat shock protein [Dendrothele bispora CBS 962.96]